jgi:DNA-binding SARP family transcriptional activator
VRALGAAALLLVLLILPPLLLASLVGDPLPHTLTGAGVEGFLRAPLSDSTVLRVVAVLGWLAWAHLAGCIGLEIVQAARGTHWRIPTGGINQQLAHRLVTAALLLLPATATAPGLTRAAAMTAPPPAAMVFPAATTGPRPAGTEHPAPAIDPRRHAEPSRPAVTMPAARPSDPGHPSAAPIYKEYVVAPPHGRWHDTLWDIAARHLGDPLRWREIFALNDGRLMPDGQRMTRANLIQPGWLLRMPPDATGLPLPSARATHQHAGSPSPSNPKAGGLAPPAHQSSPSEQPSPASAPAPRPPAPAPPDAASAAPAPGVPTAGPPIPAAGTGTGTDSPERSLPLAPAGGGLAALGLLLALDRRRRIAARRRPRGTRPAPSPTDLRAVEADLRRAARTAAPAADTVRAAVRLLAAVAPAVTVRALLHHPDGTLEVLPTVPAPPPDPFTVTDRGWALAPADRGYLLAAQTIPDPAPLLTPVGTLDGAICYLNLETDRPVILRPDTASAADDFLIVLAQALAGAPWAGLTQVVLPTRLAAAATGLERIDLCEPGSPLFHQLTRYAGTVRAGLPAGEPLDVARRSGAADDIGVVLLAGLNATDLPAPLLAAIRSPASPVTALLLDTGHDTATRNEPAGWTLRGRELHLPGWPSPILIAGPIADPATTQALLTAALAPSGSPTMTEPATIAAAVIDSSTGPTGAEPQPPLLVEPDCPADPEVRAISVDVLGPVQIHGTRAANRAGVRDLAIYLATHRRAVQADVLATTVWPDRPFNPDLLRTRMSETRRLLDGGIVHEGKTWRATEQVGCDWQRFRALAAGTAEERAAALRLVRGRAFEGYEAEWLHLEGLGGVVEAAVVDLALDVADQALADGDDATASWAARTGITACPYDERLYRVAMRAAAARGASGEVRHLLASLRTVLDADIEPDDRIEPETLATYDRAVHDTEQRRAAS